MRFTAPPRFSVAEGVGSVRPLVLIPILVALSVALTQPRSSAIEPDNRPEALFTSVALVLQQPRCLNCHPRGGDSPHQGTDAHTHKPLVVRGADDRGAPAMRCGTCHGSENNTSSGIPGAPRWQLAPKSMGWEGLSQAELCRTLTDPEQNGNRDVAQLVEHMTTDPLVQWAWNPGAGRTPPPTSQSAFHKAVRLWASAGAPCPDE
ncbi:MAG TPA: hypothetical protein VGD54_04605 [Steroidobacteraceae bacterium]